MFPRRRARRPRRTRITVAYPLGMQGDSSGVLIYAESEAAPEVVWIRLTEAGTGSLAGFYGCRVVRIDPADPAGWIDTDEFYTLSTTGDNPGKPAREANGNAALPTGLYVPSYRGPGRRLRFQEGLCGDETTGGGTGGGGTPPDDPRGGGTGGGGTGGTDDPGTDPTGTTRDLGVLLSLGLTGDVGTADATYPGTVDGVPIAALAATGPPAPTADPSLAAWLAIVGTADPGGEEADGWLDRPDDMPDAALFSVPASAPTDGPLPPQEVLFLDSGSAVAIDGDGSLAYLLPDDASRIPLGPPTEDRLPPREPGETFPGGGGGVPIYLPGTVDPGTGD